MFRLFFLVVILHQTMYAANLLFKSSFEEGVYLTQPERRDSPIWWQTLKGSDNKKGSDSKKFHWPINLQGKDGVFQMIIKDDNISNYIENSIVSMVGIDGNTSRVLQQKITQKEREDSQDPYLIYTNNKEQKKIYIRYALKFPKNLAERLGKNGWLAFCEYKTASDYRLAFYIYANEKKKLYWYVHGDNVVLDDRPYQEFWHQENFSTVKSGEWMDIEIFWNRSKGKDGRVWMAVDGKTIFDYNGKTKLEEAIEIIMLFTNYANAPITQWVDNVEIWDDFPCTKGESCLKNNKRNKK